MVGIYLIRNKIDNKVYIGQSVDLKRRIQTHKCKLKNNKHRNIYLQNSFNKYGGKNFEFIIIEECLGKELDKKEQYWIKKFDSMNREKGFNRESGGNLGRVFSIERKEKLKGKGNPMYGKHHTKEFIQKITEINRGSSDKLNVKNVSDIKKRLLNNESQIDLAKEFNVTLSTINKICKCKNWQWVESELNDKLINLTDKKKKERNKQIFSLWEQEKGIVEIAKILNCNPATVTNVLEKEKEKKKNELEKMKKSVINILEKYKISSTTYVRIITKTYNEEKQKLINKAKKLKEKGMLNKDIAKILNIHRTTVTEYLKK